jgi:flavin reductase (DIM6/NTAB) family NADH-FMN oxidoreductase RutF
MDQLQKKKTLRLFSNGMYIVTSRHAELCGAATVTWVSQASFKPPLIMAAIRPESTVFQCLTRSRLAAIHFLSENQVDIAQKFFSPTKVVDGMINGEPFALGDTLVPILENVPNFLECEVRQIHETGGDHALVILEPVEAHYAGCIRPLLIANTAWTYGG